MKRRLSPQASIVLQSALAEESEPFTEQSVLERVRPTLRQLYPNNRTPEWAVHRCLNELRIAGRLEFLGQCRWRRPQAHRRVEREDAFAGFKKRILIALDALERDLRR